jgi:uncharacterized membrane protein
METTVTGLFANASEVQAAQRALEKAGFAATAITVVTRETDHRHELLGEETSDTARGVMLGAIVGGVGLALGGALLTTLPAMPFDLHWIVGFLLGGVFGAATGAAIGLLIGSATGHQVRDEYEHLIESGSVLVAVNTDRVHAAKAQDALGAAGGRMLSTSVHRRHEAAAQRTA